LKHFVADVASRVMPGRMVACLITSDRELQNLNRVFRKKDQATDVLSFPSGEANGFAGDIAISLDRAAQQAAECGHGIEEELRILILHGILHLSGLDHETDSGEMARAEMRWRKRLGLESGLIERVHRIRTRTASSKTPPSKILSSNTPSSKTLSREIGTKRAARGARK